MAFYKRTVDGVDVFARIEDITSIRVSTINGTQGRVEIEGPTSVAQSVDFGTRALADAYAANFVEHVGLVVVD